MRPAAHRHLLQRLAVRRLREGARLIPRGARVGVDGLAGVGVEALRVLALRAVAEPHAMPHPRVCRARS